MTRSAHAPRERELDEPTVEELVVGMPVAFTVAGDATVDVEAYVDEVEEFDDDDHPRADYPRRLTLEEYHRGSGNGPYVTEWVIDPLQHRVWSKAPCDDDRERAGDLAGFTLDL